MSVIIRLQNLPWSANALDIRQYFHGLSIPEGGVHIVGGELGDAFIAFSTDEDARQAFNLNNGKIKEVQIKLMLSSRTEMQKVIEAARNQSMAAFMQAPPPAVQMPSIVPPIAPSVVPDIKNEINRERDSKDKRDKRRSRSRSRDRKERSRERDRDRDRRGDRRHVRDRSRSRSRDRNNRRRRDRSRSRDRTRSRERDRKNKDLRRPDSREGSQQKDQKPRIGVWENPTPLEPIIVPPVQTAAAFNLLEEARRNLNNLIPQAIDNANGILNQRNAFNRPQEPWPVIDRPQPNPMNDLPSRPNTFDNPDDRDRDRFEQPAPPRRSLLGNYNPRFQGAAGFNNREPLNRPEGMPNRFNRPDHETPPPLRNCCIQLQPFYGGYGELKKFFQGLYISNTGIKFVNDDFGKRTDLVYIRFTHPESKEQALLKHGSLLKNNVVEIAHLDDEEFEAIPARFRAELFGQQQEFNNPDLYRNKNPKFYNNRESAPPSKAISCLVLEDLPSFIKDQDIFKMFPDLPVESVYISNKHRNGPIAYVKFQNSEDATKVLNDKSLHVFEGKPVHVRPCRDEEYDSVENQQNEIDTQATQEEPPMVDTDCLYLTELPLKVNDRDICDFFSDVGVVPIKVHLVDGHLGFNGQAYCEFASEREASVALEKDGTILASNLISVKPVPRDEMLDALIGSNQGISNNGPLLQPPRFYQRNNYGPLPRGPFSRPPGRRFMPPPLGLNDAPIGCTVMMENVPYKAGLDEILDFFSGFDIPNENVLRRFNDNGTPSGEAKVIFNTPDEAYQAVNDKRGHKIRERLIYLTQC